MFNISVLGERNLETLSPARKKTTYQKETPLDIENLTSSQHNAFRASPDSDSSSSDHTTIAFETASDKSAETFTRTNSQCNSLTQAKSTSSSSSSSSATLSTQQKFAHKETLLISEGVILTDLSRLNKQIAIAQAALVGHKKIRCITDEDLLIKMDQEIQLEGKLQTLLEKKDIRNAEYSAIKREQERYKIDDTVDQKFWSAKSTGRGQQSLTHLWNRLSTDTVTPHKTADTPIAKAPKVNNPAAPTYKTGDIRGFFSKPVVIDLTQSASKAHRK